MAKIKDGFANVVKNIGTERDPRMSAGYQPRMLTQPTELVAAFRTTWLARRIVSVVPEDATREWRAWKADSADITKLEQIESRLQVQKKVRSAMTSARLLGGAAIYMSIGGQEDMTEQPLVGIGNGIRKLAVLGRRELRADLQTINRDPDSEFYGEPEQYLLATGDGVTKTIHQSRLIRFWGSEMPEGIERVMTTENDGWADSCLEALIDAVRDTDAAMANLSSMVYEAKTDVVRIKNLMSSMMNIPDYEETLIRRFQLAAHAKGVNGMLLLDEQDQWDQKQLTFGGLPDVVDRFFQWVSGGSGIPVTRLFMRSPAGLNATGESDIRTYYDAVRSLQTNDIAPELHKLDVQMKGEAFGSEREDVFYDWRPLWQPTFDEKAESSARIAKIGGEISDKGLLPREVIGEAVANTLIEIGAFSGLEQIIDDAGSIFEPLPEPSPEEQAALLPPRDSGNVVPFRAADIAPRSLYVSRSVLNAKAVLDHYAAQGFDLDDFLDAGDLHVTIAYSTAPVDWAKLTEPWQEKVEIVSGGMRVHDRFGSQAQVLLFTSSALAWRHEEFKHGGASWDHAEYQPHVTLTYSVDLSEAEPYTGPLVLGPELWEEVDEDWKSRVIGDKYTPATQPRHPAGSSKGGQFASTGTGSGSGSEEGNKILAALKAAASKKYGPDKIAELTQKAPSELSHYEKKVVAKYNKALKEQLGGAPEPKKEPKKPPEPPKPDPTQVAAAAVATAKYPPDAILALTNKDPKELSHYEKKVVAKYNKALKAEAVSVPKPAAPAAEVAGSKGLTPSQSKTFQSALEGIGKKYYGIQTETLNKLVSNEWSPDPAKPWQAKALEEALSVQASIQAGNYKEPSKSAPKTGGGFDPTPTSMSFSQLKGKHLVGVVSNPDLPQTAFAKVSTLTDGERAATASYSGSAYQGINKKLRDGGALDQKASAIQSAISKSSLSKDATFVRGINSAGATKFLAEAKVGAVIVDKGFVSTTRKTTVAANFAERYHPSDPSSGALIVVRARKGAKVLPIASLSQHSAEDEFLLPAGSAFKVTKIDKVTKTYYVDLI